MYVPRDDVRASYMSTGLCSSLVYTYATANIHIRLSDTSIYNVGNFERYDV